MTDEAAKTAPKLPSNLGRSSNSVISAMILRQETKIPAAPTPATAREIIKQITLGDKAQIRDPISKIETAMMKTHRRLKVINNCA